MPHDLFPLLYNRIYRENQTVPQFMGRFNGVHSLPRSKYPAMYFWIDTSLRDQFRLSFNTPLLRDWCIDEACQAGFQAGIDDESVQHAIATLQKVVAPAFERTLSKLLDTLPEGRAGTEG